VPRERPYRRARDACAPKCSSDSDVTFDADTFLERPESVPNDAGTAVLAATRDLAGPL